MTFWHLRSRRKKTGGRYKKIKKKKAYLGSEPTLTTIGERKVKIKKCRSSVKQKILSENMVNLFIPKEKSFKRVKVLTVVENPANPHYVRRNILTKGAIVQTELGRAKITSRPGQIGTINAVLLSEEK